MKKAPLLLAALMLSISGHAAEQSYPGRVVRFIAPGPPGGATDILARTIAQKLTESWGQQVIVDNRAGASGIIGTELTAKAAPDGYTIMMGHSGTHAINVGLRKTLPYDPVKDFAPITLVATAPNVLIVHPSLPARSVKELIALAKAKPGRFNYASPGIGFSQHLAGELFSTMAGIKMTHVAYKGSAPALTDVMAGNVLLMFSNIPACIAQVRSNRLRALGVSSLKRSSAMPEVPTIAESGLAGYEAIAWFGVFAPAGLPQDLVKRLHGDIVRILDQPDVRDRTVQQGADPVGNTPEEFGKFVQTEIRKWAEVIRTSGATAE